jgi:membrane protease YdiL (CAAX protease family)
MRTKRPFRWKLFFIVWIGSALASMLVLPFSISMMPNMVEGEQSLIQLTLISFINNLVLYAIVSSVGLFLAAKIGLGLPFLEAWLDGNPIWGKFKQAILLSILIGVCVGAIILLLDSLLFSPSIEAQIAEMSPEGMLGRRPPPWQGFLAAISAGITEEVLFRLFGVTLLAWLGGLLFRDSEGRPRPLILWISIFLIAISFGLAHLPATAQIGLTLNPLVIGRAILLNGIGGVAFGWLYWKRGLESAIVSHFSTDVVLHVIFTAILLGFPDLLG